MGKEYIFSPGKVVSKRKMRRKLAAKLLRSSTESPSFMLAKKVKQNIPIHYFAVRKKSANTLTSGEKA
jgi:hypothetical protein